MHHAFYGIVLFLIIFHLAFIVKCQCPEFFRYFRNETTGEIMGIVEIPNPPQGVPLHLRVIMSVATVLPTKYVGRIELAKSKEESISSVLHGTPLYYRLYFPVRHPIPAVMSIALNSFQYCTGPPAMGAIVTNIMLEHVLYPARVVIPLTDQLLNIISNNTSVAPTNPSTTTTTTTTTSPATTERRTTTNSDERETTVTPNDFPLFRPPKYKPNDNDSSCGLVSEPLDSSAEPDSPIIWPWLASIFVLKDELMFQCTGNLISRQHVLTTARCLKNGVKNISPDIMLISLGRSDLWSWKKPGSADFGVAEYIIHPNFKNLGSSDNDLAIIKLTKTINVTPNIRPVCLWMENPELNEIIGKSGYVVGWDSSGIDEIGSGSVEPRKLKMTVIPQGTCLQSSDKYRRIISSRTFCAGSRDGIDSCLISNGSGLVMYHARYNRYHLRGMVSLTMADSKSNFCDSGDYVVFIDIAKYLQWIRREIV